MATMFRTLS